MEQKKRKARCNYGRNKYIDPMKFVKNCKKILKEESQVIKKKY